MVNAYLPLRLLQTAWRWLTQRLFLAAYESSDSAHWQFHTSQSRWEALGDILDFSTEFLVTNEDGKLVYLLAFRVRTGARLKHVAISVKARKAGVIHQEYIDIGDLDDKPVRKALSAIPLNRQPGKEVFGQASGHIYIRLAEAVDADGVDLTGGERISMLVRPVCVDAGNHLYESRWGRYWNIDAIDLQMNALKSHWFRRIVKPAGQLWRPLRLRRTIFWALTNRCSLAALFWTRNLFDAKQLRGALPADGRQVPPAENGPALSSAGLI